MKVWYRIKPECSWNILPQLPPSTSTAKLRFSLTYMTRPSSSTTLTHASPTLSRTNVEPPREDAQAAVHVYSRTCLGLKVLTCKFHALRNACSGLTPLRAIAHLSSSFTLQYRRKREWERASKREREIEGETVGSLMISSRSRSLACDLEKLLVSCLFSNWDHSETIH